jgi:hypothetical protein
MQNYILKLILVAGLSLGFLLSVITAKATGESPHHISNNHKATECTTCHTENPDKLSDKLLDSKNHRVDLNAYKADGIEMCTTCHDAENGHKVNLKLDFEVPADMPVGKKNTINCLTCHYTHGNLESERPQASFSFMDRLVDAERLHKSYLLRRNNTDGELCLICHSVNEGAK